MPMYDLPLLRKSTAILLLCKVLAVLMCFAMIAAAFVGCKKKDDVITIGLTGPLTGGASIYGIAVRNAAQLAVDEINEAGGRRP